MIDVRVRQNGHDFIGELSIQDSLIALVIHGENSDDRSFDFDGYKKDELQCDTLRESFLLRNLQLQRWSSHFLNSANKSTVAFKAEYKAQEIYLTRGGYGTTFPRNVAAIEIASKQIGQWIGRTAKQDSIIGSFGAAFEADQEFLLPLENQGAIAAIYKIKKGYSLPEFKSEMTFAPSLELVFESTKTIEEATRETKKLISLLSFVFGLRPCVDTVKFHYASTGYARFSTCKSIHWPHKIQEESTILAPYNIMDPTDGGNPWQPIFSKYFSNDFPEREVFDKYEKYRQLDNIEERLLGYFRLLEKLTHKKAHFLDSERLISLMNRSEPFLVKYFNDPKNVRSFLRQIERANGSKYNTEKCLSDFLSSISESRRKDWALGKRDLANICKLRNDIIHANEYSIEEDKIYQMTAFVEILLTYKLSDLILFPRQATDKFVERHPMHRIIEHPPTVRHTNSAP